MSHNGGQRAKKRRRRDARKAQRTAWAVELRLLGYPDHRIKFVMAMGTHEYIRHAYLQTMMQPPAYWSKFEPHYR
jgi:hypothetical protein